MKANLGSIERVIRFIIGAGLIAIGVTFGYESLGGIVAIIVGIILILTAVIKFCPIWFGFGISTNKKCNRNG